ncbi:hypothetical protein F5J12DRAFT_929109 [Pisolithus orientalis]|uniref:uncharacterized protein n=1 Tax=Pisolithus orientalis TaxID=936130 RepID=UPI002224CB05|nr:uncharacterized protein F5J12DRAFT_929109 [Pisolithus orientalis]KAI5996908.1 hypothetical protein F5J12DRAFT_929109 [Pisolithus orientalis]
MKARFQEEVFSGPCALPDILILFLVLCEADCISSVISQAYHCPINVGKNWGGKTCNAEAAERYTEMTEPSILVTNSNTIHVWYLPDALSPKRRANIWNHLHLLREPLWESIKASPQAWQMDKSYFSDNAELKGTINLSPTWFQQGHGPQNGFPEASWLLKSRTENTSTREWVDQMSDTNALLSAILHGSIDLPWQTGRTAGRFRYELHVEQHVHDGESGNLLPQGYQWTGSMVQHWSMGWQAVDGDRACLAYYMHANVHQLVHIPMCQSPWMDNLLPRPVATGELLI